MENYIDLIEAYLNKTLSESEVLAFENRLKTDTEFNAIYKEHLIVLKGIERTKTKLEINDAKINFIRGKRFKQVGITIGVLIFASLIWFLVSKNSAKNELKEILNFETEMIQSFNVSTDSIISIVGEKGILISINPNDLELKSKKTFSPQNLTIELIELTNQQDLLFANAQTVSDGKWLISGGAFKIDIKADNESLVLKEGKTLSVKFPKNTNKDEMQIFYGKREENGYLNWELSDVELNNENQFVIFVKDTFMLDEVRTRAFGGVETFRMFLKVDTLGFMNIAEINTRFPKIQKSQNQKDTLIVHRELIEYGEVEFYESRIIEDNNINALKNKRYTDSVLTIYNSKTKRIIENDEKRKGFYESIEISKLGWINIDQYAKYEDKITIKLKNNLGFDFNTYGDQAYPDNSVWHETYLIDSENNTILNVYSSAVEIPGNKSFTIISCALVDDTFYVCRKAIKFTDDNDVLVEYKKRNKSQIKSLLRLDINSTKEEKPKEKVVTTVKKEVEDTIVEKEIVNRKVSSTNNTLPFFKSMYKEPQLIKVNAEENFKITLKEGTKISIPANAFMDSKTKKEVNGEVSLKVTEYYKLSDILLADLSTKSDDEILETGGMLYLEAYKNGSKLKLKPQKELKVVFNNSGKPNMQLFKGDKINGQMNWKLNEQILDIETDEQIDELTGEIKGVGFVSENYSEAYIAMQFLDEAPIYPNCDDGNNEARRKCMNDEIEKVISRKFNTSIAEELGLSGKIIIRTSFEIDKEGNIGKIEVRASHKELAEEAVRVIELLPKLKPGKFKGEDVDVMYYLPIMIQLEGETIDELPSITLKSDRAFTETFNKKQISEISESEIERYTLATTNLGWINCDRFVRSNNRKIKYKIKIKDSEGANVKMIFKSISSVLPSNRTNNEYNFGEVPVNEDVILLAIKKKGSTLYLGTKYVRTNTISEVDLNFKEVTIDELKTELIKLNKDFN